jgi:hypothetical protein
MFGVFCEKCGGENDQRNYCSQCKKCMDKEYARYNRHIPHQKQIYSSKKGMRTYIKNNH